MANFWKLVNKVIDESDVVLEILDARLVDDTRNSELEEKVRSRNKKLILVINKCDLVDKWLMDKKKKELSNVIFISAKEHLGTTMLKTRILELGAAPKDEKITVGVVGYPNTGKSSVINALCGRAKAGTSSQSGFTKGIQKIRAGPRIVLLDTPGVIPFKENDDYKHAIIGTLDPSKVKDPEFAAQMLIDHLEGAIERHYGIKVGGAGKATSDDIAQSEEGAGPEENAIIEETDSYEILEEIARKQNKLRKGAEPDTELIARMMIRDWQQGKIRI